MSLCPRCSFALPASPDNLQCPRCGVVFSRFAEHLRKQAHRRRAVASLWAGLLVVLTVTVVWAQPRIYRHLMRRNVELTPLPLDGEPTQEPLAAAQTQPIQIDSSNPDLALQPLFSYHIAGRVVAHDHFYMDKMSMVSPVDVSLAWGRLVAPDALALINYSHHLRFGWVSYKQSLPFEPSVLAQHFSNNHLIPANTRLAGAMRTIDDGDDVEIIGTLVNVTLTTSRGMWRANTSISRTDTGDGACEIIYVTRLRVGSNVFY